jgi:hypothetical protein
MLKGSLGVIAGAAIAAMATSSNTIALMKAALLRNSRGRIWLLADAARAGSMGTLATP